MPVIYISPYYSLLDYAMALEGVYGFRHFDRYGNDQAVATLFRAYDPAIVPVGFATGAANEDNNGRGYGGGEAENTGLKASEPLGAPGNLTTQVLNLGSEFWSDDLGSSIDWKEGVIFNLISVNAEEPTNTNMGYYLYDSSLATATQSPGWVEGNQLASADVIKVPRNLSEQEVDSSNIYMPYQGYGFPTPYSRANGDPYWDNVVALLHLESNLTDVKGHSITAGNGALTYATFSKFGTASVGPLSNKGLVLAPSSDWQFPGDFTVEAWAYPITDDGASMVIWGLSDFSTLYFYSAGSGAMVLYVNGTSITTSTQMYQTGQWNHIAVARSGSTIRIFINGIAAPQTITTSAIVGVSDANIYIGGYCPGANPNQFNGYLDEIRVTKGVARYTSSFTVPNTAFTEVKDATFTFIQIPPAKEADSKMGYHLYDSTLARATGVKAFPPTEAIWAKEANSKMGYHLYDSTLARATPVPSFAPANELGAADAVKRPPNLSEQEAGGNLVRVFDGYGFPTPYSVYSGDFYAAQVVLLAHLDNNLTDEKGHTLTGVNPSFTATNKFGTHGFSCSGSYFQTPATTDFALTTGDFTVEFWAYPTDTSARCPVCYGDYAGPVYGFSVDFNNSTIYLNGLIPNSTGTTTTSSVAYSINTWYHIAVTRASGTMSLFVNGGLIGSIAYNNTMTDYFRFGAGDSATSGVRTAQYPFLGIIDEVRITKGWARYTSNFIRPNEAFTLEAPTLVAFDQIPIAKYPLTASRNISEQEATLDNITQLYVPTVTTYYNMALLGNPLEGATLTPSGTLQAYPYPSSNWYSSFSNISIQDGLAAYFECYNGSGTTLMVGFTTHNSSSITNFNFSDPGAAITAVGQTITVTKQSATDYVVYGDAGVGSTAGDVWGCLLDLSTGVRTVKFYRNGVYIGMYTNLPAGKTWYAAIDNYSTNTYRYARFNQASWTRLPEGFAFTAARPACIYDGTARELYRIPVDLKIADTPIQPAYLPVPFNAYIATEASKITRNVEAETDTSSLTQLFQGLTVSSAITPVKTGNLLDGSTLNTGILTASTTNFKSWFAVKSRVDLIPTSWSAAITDGQVAYYELYLTTASSLMIGYTTGNGYPNGGATMDTNYSSLSTSTLGASISGASIATDCIVYVNTITGSALAAGDVYQVWLDLRPNYRQMVIYRNDSVVQTVYSLPTGRSWLPAFSLNSMAVTARFNSTSWTRYNASSWPLTANDTTEGGTATGEATAIENYPIVIEQQSDISQITQLYTPLLSTAEVVAQNTNRLENVVLNTTGSYQSWRSTFATWGKAVGLPTTSYPARITEGIAYFEVYVTGNTPNLILGFTRGNGYPNDGSSLATYYQNFYSAGVGGIDNVGGSSYSDFTVYVDNITNVASGTRCGCLLNLQTRTLKVYHNNSLIYTLTNLPAGQSWIPCFSIYSNNASYVAYGTPFTIAAQWAYGATVAAELATDVYLQKASTVDGIAKDVYAITLSTLLGTLQNRVWEPAWTYIYPASGAIDYRTIATSTGDITYRNLAPENAVLLAALPSPTTTGDTSWGSLITWVSNIGNTTYRIPKYDQDAIHLIGTAHEQITFSDYWGLTPVGQSRVGTTTYRTANEEAVFITESVALIYNQTTKLDFASGNEQRAGVNVSAYYVPWDYDVEITLYPLSSAATSGLSNTTNFSSV